MPSIEVRLPFHVRLLSGHPMKLQHGKDYNTKQPKFKDGNPVMECFYRVGVPKTDPGLYGADGVFALLAQAAGRPWPADGNPATDHFAWKIDDGDAQYLDEQTGQHKSRPEAWHGMWVFGVKSTGWVGNCAYKDAQGSYQPMMDAAQIKPGDYVDIIIKAEPNNSPGSQAGIYLNPVALAFNEAGAALSTGGGMDTSEMATAFAGSAAQTPSAPVQQPMQPAPVQQPMQPAPVTQPMQPAPVTQPMQPVPVQQPMQPAPVQQPMQPAPVAQPMQPAPVQQPMQPAPVAQPMPQPTYNPNFAAGPAVPVA